jgi:hypothetical protein
VVARQFQQMGAHRVVAVILGQAGVLGQPGECGRRAVDHRVRHRVIQADHRVVRQVQEQVVQGEDLWPVRLGRARRLVVDRRDGGL